MPLAARWDSHQDDQNVNEGRRLEVRPSIAGSHEGEKGGNETVSPAVKQLAGLPGK